MKMKVKIVLIEEEDKNDERIPIGSTELALSVQIRLLLGAMKDIGFIEDYETVKGKQTDEIHVYPRKLDDVEYIVERIVSEIEARNQTVQFIKDERKARLRELAK
jgi:ribosomal protein S8